MGLMESLSEVFSRAGLKNEASPWPDGAVFSDKDDRFLFSFIMRTYPSEATALLESFTVGQNYRGTGQKIGGTAIKHMAGYLEREGVETLELFHVQDDGLTFWPAMGALPSRHMNFGPVMERVHSSLPEGHCDYTKLGEAIKKFPQAPEDTWFEMTDAKSETGLSRWTFWRVSQLVLAEQPYVLDFKRPEVRHRLALD